MANSVEATLAMTLNVVETLGTDADSVGSSNNTVTHNQFSKAQVTLNSASTPAVSQVYSQLVTMTAGAKTLDLTSLATLNGGTFDATGLTIIAMRLKASSGNANPITIEPGAANGYDFQGADWQWTGDAEDEALFYSDDNAPTVAGADKDLDISGTGSQTIEVTILFSD